MGEPSHCLPTLPEPAKRQSRPAQFLSLQSASPVLLRLGDFPLCFTTFCQPKSRQGPCLSEVLLTTLHLHDISAAGRVISSTEYLHKEHRPLDTMPVASRLRNLSLLCPVNA